MSEQKRKQRPKSRGNGQGCAYQRPGEKTWTVEVVVGWKYPNGDITKPKRPVRRKRGGFRTKKEALLYADTLKKQGDKRVTRTLEDVWFEWKDFYASRIGASTMDGYFYAFKHFSKLHGVNMDKITPNDLQECMDNCKSGKRTHENMKCIAGLLWKYAVDKNIIDRNIASNLYKGDGKSVQREPLTDQEEAIVKDAIGKEFYAPYVYSLCYLGYRPGEFLRLRKDQLFCAQLDIDDKKIDVYYFVNGVKTDAGRDRVVIVPDEILPLIIERTNVEGTDLIFPQYRYNRKKPPEFLGFKEMTDAYFREEIFKPMMKRLGIAEKKTPYSTRDSFADKLKKASGSDKDKAALIGHSSYLTTVDKYQSTHLKDLYDLVNSFGKNESSSTPTATPTKNAATVEK